jgi:hypothetical protein
MNEFPSGQCDDRDQNRPSTILPAGRQWSLGMEGGGLPTKRGP